MLKSSILANQLNRIRHNHCFFNDYMIFLHFIFVFTIVICIFAPEIYKTLIICGQNLVIQLY